MLYCMPVKGAQSSSLIQFVKNELLLVIFLILLILLSLIYPEKIREYPQFVDWKTIATLTGLLIITTALKESGYFYIFSMRMLRKFRDERSMALFMVLISAVLATFLTNDVALFIVVPITLSLQEILNRDASKLIIFEALAVNAGSALTPIGNPQNIFLWHSWGISFLAFMVKMVPLASILLLVLLLFVYLFFSRRDIELPKKIMQKEKKCSLFYISLAALLLYLAALELNLVYFAVPIIILLYLFLHRKTLWHADWLLILLFIVIFIDFSLISKIPAVHEGISSINLNTPKNLFLFSAFLSQLVSNVPATVMLSNFSSNWLVMGYGVNVGGNGVVIASLANIIALRLAKKRRIWISFHKYSLLYLLITLGIFYALFSLH